MTDELENLRRIKALAAELMAIDAEKERVAMNGKLWELGAVHQRYRETWTLLQQELAA